MTSVVPAFGEGTPPTWEVLLGAGGAERAASARAISAASRALKACCGVGSFPLAATARRKLLSEGPRYQRSCSLRCLWRECWQNPLIRCHWLSRSPDRRIGQPPTSRPPINPRNQRAGINYVSPRDDGQNVAIGTHPPAVDAVLAESHRRHQRHIDHRPWIAAVSVRGHPRRLSWPPKWT
jgi:hypothetical protein